MNLITLLMNDGDGGGIQQGPVSVLETSCYVHNFTFVTFHVGIVK